jgi:putative acetyltransferase
VEAGYGEVKRMYVAPAARGQGLGRQMLAAIEARAAGEGLELLRLETGIRQAEALGLYRASGYADCEPFGSYLADPLSVFMEKRLTRP